MEQSIQKEIAGWIVLALVLIVLCFFTTGCAATAGHDLQETINGN